MRYTHLTLRRRTFLTALVISAITSGVASAKHFTIENTAPTDFDQEIRPVVEENIPADLEKAQCGGWNTEESARGKIPEVDGLPGHPAEDPFGNIRSGMALRDEDFSFPAVGSTQGFSTVCASKVGGEPQSWAKIELWSGNGPITDRIHTDHKKYDAPEPPPITYPYFEAGQKASDDNDPCLWRAGWTEIDPPINETQCNLFCGWLRNPEYSFWDCRQVLESCVGDDPPLCSYSCVEWAQRYTCTGQWVDTGYDNCRTCIGAECRCPGPGCVLSPGKIWGTRLIRNDFDGDGVIDEARDQNVAIPVVINDAQDGGVLINGNAAPYASFFRKYVGTYRRAGVEEVEDDITSKTVQAMCYTFYEEFDPKSTRTSWRDQICVMDIDVSPYKENQKGKGTYQASSAASDPAGPIRRASSFSPQDDLWYPNLGGGISLLNNQVFEDDLKSDLSYAILQSDTAMTQTARPFQDPGKKTASSALLRAFDDTVSYERGDERSIAQWWQKFESEAHTLFAPPTVHLLLPPTWSFGVDSLDPIFVGQTSTSAAGRKDPRMEAIDVQLEAREDMLGQIAAYLERNLLVHVEEEPVPVVMPLASPTELRAHKQAWETWKRIKKGPNGSNTFAGEAEVDALIARIEEYAEQVETIRKFRAELPRYIGSITGAQGKIAEEIGNWMTQNINVFQQYVQNAQERLRLRGRWVQIQQKMVDFHDKTNQPWCRNERFLVPIYSFLDSWFPGRPNLTGYPYPPGAPSCASLDGLPMLCANKGEDLVVDFSNMRIRSGSLLRVPVLKPTLIRLAIPTPPGDGEEIPDPDALQLPAFPEVPSIFEKIPSTFPEVEVRTPLPGVLDTPPLADLTQPRIALDEADWIITNMDFVYKKYWDSLRAFDPGEKPLQCKDKDMNSLDCCGFGNQHCAHVEMDLMERLQRVGARPGILLKEDFESKGNPRKPKDASDLLTCDPADHVCRPLLPEHRQSKDGWQIAFPPRDASKEEKFLEDLRKEMRDATLTEDATEIRSGNASSGTPFPYKARPHDLYPIYGVPNAIDLTPPKSSSSSSSSP